MRLVVAPCSQRQKARPFRSYPRLLSHLSCLNKLPWPRRPALAVPVREPSRGHQRAVYSRGIPPELAVPVREVLLVHHMQEAVKGISTSSNLHISRCRQRSRLGRAPAEDRLSLREEAMGLPELTCKEAQAARPPPQVAAVPVAGAGTLLILRPLRQERRMTIRMTKRRKRRNPQHPNCPTPTTVAGFPR